MILYFFKKQARTILAKGFQHTIIIEEHNFINLGVVNVKNNINSCLKFL